MIATHKPKDYYSWHGYTGALVHLDNAYVMSWDGSGILILYSVEEYWDFLQDQLEEYDRN